MLISSAVKSSVTDPSSIPVISTLQVLEIVPQVTVIVAVPFLSGVTTPLAILAMSVGLIEYEILSVVFVGSTVTCNVD